MEYLTIAQEMLQSLQIDLENYLQGRKENYFYQEEISEEYGTSDRNYTNRTRLCYALFYAEQEIPDQETIIRELFREEVISRENDGFQGIGVNLELLSVMLREYEPVGSALFYKAKTANFDCMCGYNPAIYRYESLAELDLPQYIRMAGDMNLQEYACRFVDVFKQQELTLSKLQDLKSFALHDTKRECDNEFAITKIYELMAHDPDTDRHSFDFCFAVEEYIELLTQKQAYAQALQLFFDHADSFRDHPQSYCMLGSEFFLCDRLNDPTCKESIWRKIHPLILEMIREEELPMNYCTSFAECAERMGELELSRELREIYANFLKECEEDD